MVSTSTLVLNLNHRLTVMDDWNVISVSMRGRIDMDWSISVMGSFGMGSEMFCLLMLDFWGFNGGNGTI